MKRDFIIFPLLCITLLQIILVNVSPTFAVIHKENINDIQLLRKYREASILQLNRGVEIFFPRNLRGYLTEAGLKNEYSNQDNISRTEIWKYENPEICANRVLARVLGVVDATFAAALIADPEITSAAISARPALVNGLLDLLRGLCSALTLAVGKKSSTTTAEIQAITDKIVPAAADWNLQFFNAIGMGRELQPRVYLVLKEAEKRSTDMLTGAFNESLIGLQKLASIKLQVENEEIASIMNTFRERAFSKYLAHAEEKFDASETLLITFPTTGSDHDAHSSANEDKNMVIQCGAYNATEMAKLQIEKGYSTKINTIQLLLHKTAAKSSNSSQNDQYEAGTAKEKTIAVFNSAIIATMDAVIKMYPECSSIVRATRHAVTGKMKKIVNNIYNSIHSIQKSGPERVLDKLEASEIETIGAASGVIIDLFEGILGCVQQAGDAVLRTSVEPQLEKAVMKIKELFRIIFTAIKIRTVEISSGIQGEGETRMLILKEMHAKAFTSGRTAMEIIVDVIVSCLKTSINKQLDKPASLFAIQIYREKISFKIEKGVNIIFSNIAISEDVATDDSSDIIKRSHAVTSAAYTVALKNLFCSSEKPSSRSTWVDGKKAFFTLQQAVDGMFSALTEAAGKKSCEILPHLKNIRVTVTNHFIEAISLLYDEIRRRSSIHIVQLEPALSNNQNMTISGVEKTAIVVFKGIRILASSNCPSSKAGESNIFSSFTGHYNNAFSTLDTFIKDLTHGVKRTPLWNVDNILQQVSTITSRVQARMNLPPLVPIRISGGLSDSLSPFQPQI